MKEDFYFDRLGSILKLDCAGLDWTQEMYNYYRVFIELALNILVKGYEIYI